MQEANRENTLQVGIWTRRSSSLRLFDTKSVHCNNYRYDRKRPNIGKVGSTHGIGRRLNHSWFPLGGTKRKG
jgi:hypothetical protein